MCAYRGWEFSLLYTVSIKRAGEGNRSRTPYDFKCRAISMEGTVSGEHGVGIGKIIHIEEEHGKDHIELRRAIKRGWDPKNIMNPGKLFILPTVPGGPCEMPSIYNQTKDGATKGTYTH